MAELKEGQFEIDGYLFGRTCPVRVTNFTITGGEGRRQDAVNPVGENLHFGRDYRGMREWLFALRATGRALVAGGEVERAWVSDDDDPDAESVLRYMVDGRVRRVYGRARDFLPEPHQRIPGQLFNAKAAFTVSHVNHFDDASRTVVVDGLPAEGGGVVPPFTPPVLLAPSGPRSGIIDDVGGDAQAPVEITVHGPALSPTVDVGGHLVSLPGLELAYDQSVTVDTRRSTVLLSTGGSVAGLVSRRTYLPDVRLSPGAAEIIFNGGDPTGTARCEVTWHPAWTGF